MKSMPRHAASLLAPLALAAGACRDQTADSPTGPPPAIRASAEELSAARIGVADATSRVLPSLLSLERLANEAELGAQLDAIADALERSDAAALARGVTRAERVLARLESKDDGRGASDIDAIRIALAEARRLMRDRSEAEGGANTSRGTEP